MNILLAVRSKLHAARYMILGLVLGLGIATGFLNLFNREGQIVTDQAEAEGPDFSNPNMVDLYSHVETTRVCPKMSQRYAWRWEMYKGKRVQHAYPLFSTTVPFLPDGPDVVMSGPAVGIPDPSNGGWLERTNSSESCSWLPSFFGGWFVPTVKKGPDVPTNFIGGSQQKDAP